MNRMNSMDGMSHGFIPKHGGYRNLVVYRVAEIIYDFTFRFCNKYVKNQGRTYDQMVQEPVPACRISRKGAWIQESAKRLN